MRVIGAVRWSGGRIRKSARALSNLHGVNVASIFAMISAVIILARMTKIGLLNLTTKKRGEKMKILVLCCVVVLMVVSAGCAGFQVSDTSTHKILAYGAGKGMAIGINKVRPEVDPDLTNAWVEMMDANAGKEMVESLEMVAFYNHVLIIIAGGEYDKYGLVGDLAVLLTIFAADMDPQTHQMISIDPVPYAILQYFEMGYANGRAVARKEME